MNTNQLVNNIFIYNSKNFALVLISSNEVFSCAIMINLGIRSTASYELYKIMFLQFSQISQSNRFSSQYVIFNNFKGWIMFSKQHYKIQDIPKIFSKCLVLYY